MPNGRDDVPVKSPTTIATTTISHGTRARRMQAREDSRRRTSRVPSMGVASRVAKVVCPVEVLRWWAGVKGPNGRVVIRPMTRRPAIFRISRVGPQRVNGHGRRNAGRNRYEAAVAGGGIPIKNRRVARAAATVQNGAVIGSRPIF